MSVRFFILLSVFFLVSHQIPNLFWAVDSNNGTFTINAFFPQFSQVGVFSEVVFPGNVIQGFTTDSLSQTGFLLFGNAYYDNSSLALFNLTTGAVDQISTGWPGASLVDLFFLNGLGLVGAVMTKQSIPSINTLEIVYFAYTNPQPQTIVLASAPCTDVDFLSSSYDTQANQYHLLLYSREGNVVLWNYATDLKTLTPVNLSVKISSLSTFALGSILGIQWNSFSSQSQIYQIDSQSGVSKQIGNPIPGFCGGYPAHGAYDLQSSLYTLCCSDDLCFGNKSLTVIQVYSGSVTSYPVKDRIIYGLSFA